MLLKQLNKIIRFGLTLSTHNKVVLFLCVLISLSLAPVNAQTLPGDTLKKSNTDTLATSEDEAGDDELEEQIKYSATDSIVALPEKGLGILYGKAWVTYGSMRIDAEFIEIDYTKNLVVAYGKKDSLGKSVGNPVFKEGEEEMSADKIMYNLKTKKGKIFNALTKQGELLVIGQEIKKDSTNVVYMKNMRCIPCQEEDARTAFKATKAKIIPDDKIVTGPMYLEIGGVPTPLGLPFGYFPNTKKQHSGIIIPKFGTSAERGLNLREGGFYWGISDKTDMVIQGDVYANGSWMLNTVNNYNVLYKARGAVRLSYSQFNNGDKDIPREFNKQVAYQVNWLHNQDNKSNPTIQFGANVNFVKNQSFNRFNSINSGQYLQNSFQSNISFTKMFKSSSLSLNAMHSQNAISKEVDITLPILTYNVNRFFPFKREGAVRQNVFDKIGVSYLLTAQNTLRGYDSTIFKGDLEDKMRYGIKHSIPISTNFNVLKYITVSPGINLNAYMYTKSTEKVFIQDYIPGRTLIIGGGPVPIYVPIPGRDTMYTKTNRGFVGGYDANFSTAFNTKVYFDYVFGGGKVKQIRHLMMPTLTYGYRPDYGKENFGFWKQVQTDRFGKRINYSIFENGIYGGPAIGEQNSLSINLNNTLDAKIKQRTDTGITYNKVSLIQNLSLNTSYNFAADSFKMSNVGITGRTVLFKNFDINASSVFDPYAYNKEIGKRIKAFSYTYDNRLLRFTDAYLTVGTNFSSNKLQAARKLRKPPDMTNGAERGATPDLDPEEALPWNIYLTYNLTLSNHNDTKIEKTHALNATADMKPTKYWKIGVTSGYDFTNKKLSYTSFDIYRDLKCWEAGIKWVPFGYNKSYQLTLNLKTSMLSDFKIPKQSKSMDNPQLTELFR
jgi:hypothetical protein